MPIIGLGLAGGFYYAGISERVMTLMVMIIYAAPTSLQLLMICSTHKNQVENISKVYLIMYATSAIPMALWTMLFLILLYG
jgi:predicted permease